MSLGPTLRWAMHLRPSQIGWRLLRRLQRPFLKLALGTDEMPVRFPQDSWPGDSENGLRVANGEICLLNRTHRLAVPIDWYPCHQSALWRFTLHYFEWLGDLKAVGRPDVARNLVADWIYQNTSPRAEAWHPYPLSLRLFSWLRFAPFLLEGADAHFRTLFLSSLNQHARQLPKLIEFDVGGNHLVKNLKALIAASVCLPSMTAGLDTWLDKLRVQLEEQILPDGFHYERSPSYHLQVLIDLIDLSDVLITPPAWLSESIRRMLPALATMRHPDGGLALFNDGDVGDPFLLNALDARFGKIDPLSLLPDAGYARLEAADMVVIFDAGLCCPDHLTAHAHADTLSFEMSVGKERVIVNSGTYAYQDKKWRNHFRGTAAHSTIMVNNENSAEVFGVFRLGRRPRKVELFKDGDWITGRHDGYRHLGITVERRLRLTEKGLEGRDCILGTFLPFTSFFHSPCNTRQEPLHIGSLTLLCDGVAHSSSGELACKYGQLFRSSVLSIDPHRGEGSSNPTIKNFICWTLSKTASRSAVH
ncbi:MAG: heparinase II/III family protein [Alphaproteobacteria bacterium]|nr:heparinase II/III family protein [Alphaproteobacteria bacterium]